jgi:NAD(P)-dependent dehydrogenase (short-subunit alcohol dehydrogenase family)
MSQSAVNCMVTGASSGIGAELVRQMLVHPNVGKVIAIGRKADLLRSHEAHDPHSRLIALPFDICSADRSPLLGALSQIDHLGLLVNNAGQLLNRPSAEIAIHQLESVYRTNVFAPFQLIHEVFPWLLRSPSRAHVVNIGSIGGVQGSVKFPGLSAYSSSKGALAVLTECLAEEHHNAEVSFNCLALGAVQTEMLEAAFPGFKAPVGPQAMAEHILRFGLYSPNLFNGKVIPISISTP